MTEWQSDCIHFEVEQDTDDYGRYIAPPVCYCTKEHQECNIKCIDYEKW